MSDRIGMDLYALAALVDAHAEEHEDAGSDHSAAELTEIARQLRAISDRTALTVGA